MLTPDRFFYAPKIARTNILFCYYSFAFISTDPSLPGEPE